MSEWYVVNADPTRFRPTRRYDLRWMEPDLDAFDVTATRVFAGVRDGEGAAEALLAHYLPRLRAFVRARIGEQLRRRESESDVVQSICRGILAERGQLEFEAEAQFRAWLFTAALNKIREKGRFWGRERRSRDHEVDRDIGELSHGYAGMFTPSRIASANEEIERLEHLLEQLPEEYREVISLCRVARLPHEQVATLMGKSVGAVRQMLGRALRKLAEEYRANESE